MHRTKCSDCLVGTVRQAGVGGHHPAFQVSTATLTPSLSRVPLQAASASSRAPCSSAQHAAPQRMLPPPPCNAPAALPGKQQQ